MDYGKLLSRAWTIIWDNKWLIVLGVLVALGSGYGGSPGNTGYRFGPRDFERDFNFDEFDPERDFGPGFRDFPDRGFDPRSLFPTLGAGLAMAIIIPLIILAVIVGIALWVVATIARGGLIVGVDAIESGGTSSFSRALGAGWQNGWRLVGIGLLPAIPGVVLLITGLGLGGALFGLYSLGQRPAAAPAFAGLGATLGVIACVAALAALVLNLLRTFAERACMLEDKGVFESYGRGWKVLSANLGPAIILFLIQILLGIGVALATLVLSPVLCLFCLLIVPIMLIIEGGVASYFSTLWTLAWREWTGRGISGEPVAEASPAV